MWRIHVEYGEPRNLRKQEEPPVREQGDSPRSEHGLQATGGRGPVWASCM
jgi:hypothetical protein